MSDYKSTFLQTLSERDFIHQCTHFETLDERACQDKPLAAYIGFDATADSLHVGSLLPIMMLKHLQKSGHKPIVLMGGGTTKIGDPSGKDKSRTLLSEDQIDQNIQSIKKIFERYLTFGDGPTDAIILNNADWLDHLNYTDFLRDFGAHFTVNRMLTFDSVKLRLDREQPLTFLEFNYMIFQAYDFLVLNKTHDCVLQMGGSDQWGNIVNGVELIRRIENKESFGLTSPLLTTASGAKMGKTADGAIWLNADRLSPFDFWQYWRNTEDADVGRFLKLFTELPSTQIDALENLAGSDINEAKKILAFEVTKLCHGEEEAEKAQKMAEKIFEQGQIDDNLPTIEISSEKLQSGILVYELFREGGLCKSNGEARRLIKGGGAKLNDSPIQEETLEVSLDDFSDDNIIKLSAGKKRHILVKAC